MQPQPLMTPQRTTWQRPDEHRHHQTRQKGPDWRMCWLCGDCNASGWQQILGQMVPWLALMQAYQMRRKKVKPLGDARAGAQAQRLLCS